MTVPVKTTKPKVAVGPTSIVGWLTAGLGVLPMVIKAIEEGSVAVQGPEKYLAVFGIAAGLITQVFRYIQSLKA